jgi:hypothetical protein
VSYTDKLLANASRLEGVVAERWVSVGAPLGLPRPMVERAGAEELEWLKRSVDDVDVDEGGFVKGGKTFSGAGGYGCEFECGSGDGWDNNDKS